MYVCKTMLIIFRMKISNFTQRHILNIPSIKEIENNTLFFPLSFEEFTSVAGALDSVQWMV